MNTENHQRLQLWKDRKAQLIVKLRGVTSPADSLESTHLVKLIGHVNGIIQYLESEIASLN